MIGNYVRRADGVVDKLRVVVVDHSVNQGLDVACGFRWHRCQSGFHSFESVIALLVFCREGKLYESTHGQTNFLYRLKSYFLH